MCGSFSVSKGRQLPSATVLPWRTITKPWMRPSFAPSNVFSQASIQSRIAWESMPCDSGLAGSISARHVAAASAIAPATSLIKHFPFIGFPPE